MKRDSQNRLIVYVIIEGRIHEMRIAEPPFEPYLLPGTRNWAIAVYHWVNGCLREWTTKDAPLSWSCDLGSLATLLNIQNYIYGDS